MAKDPYYYTTIEINPCIILEELVDQGENIGSIKGRGSQGQTNLNVKGRGGGGTTANSFR